MQTLLKICQKSIKRFQKDGSCVCSVVASLLAVEGQLVNSRVQAVLCHHDERICVLNTCVNRSIFEVHTFCIHPLVRSAMHEKTGCMAATKLV